MTEKQKYHQRCLEKGRRYCEENKERQKKLVIDARLIFEDEENWKREYDRNRYRNMSEKNKIIWKTIQKKYIKKINKK